MALTAEFLAGTKARASEVNESSVPVVSSTTDITAPFTGQIVFATADNMLYRYGGASWQAFDAAGGTTAPTRHEARYDHTTIQAIPNATDTKVQFPTATTTTDDVTASGAGNQDFLLNRAGLWRISAGLRMASSVADDITLFVSTGTVIGTLANRFGGQTVSIAGTNGAGLSLATDLRVTAATSVFVGVFQNRGSSLNTDVGFGATGHLALTWLRPVS